MSVLTFPGMWAALLPVGRDDGTGGYRRFAWSRADHDLREWFAQEAQVRGLDLTEDRMGNQWAWWGNPDRDGPGLVFGSHLDSVPDGGAYDGPLGVVSAFAALDHLRDTGHQPDKPIAIANFVDEEGARFGIALAGSRVITGLLDADRARGLTDEDGVTMAEAMRAAGRDPAQIGQDPETLARVGTYVELHVEQGRALADLNAAVAIGTDIWPHGRWRIDLPGEANHAGTTRLQDRRDAVLSLAGVIQQTRSAAEQRGCLATIGKVRIEPGGVNAIASHATAWLDARGDNPEAVRGVIDDVTATTRALGGEVHEESWTPVTAFAPDLIAQLSRALPGAPTLGTGAGHDAGVLAQAGIPTAMLFVRNPTGVSHSPAEYAEEPDCLAGVEALATVAADLTGGSP
ncbi:allantoate amidohydrolase [Nostocoides veronense]|uniref:Allantoate amidohydrolase n=1 Tax=Nostocoides veronense TaxID=330836 RepID=A0ABN2LLH5_9MICO